MNIRLNSIIILLCITLSIKPMEQQREQVKQNLESMNTEWGTTCYAYCNSGYQGLLIATGWVICCPCNLFRAIEVDCQRQQVFAQATLAAYNQTLDGIYQQNRN